MKTYLIITLAVLACMRATAQNTDSSAMARNMHHNSAIGVYLGLNNTYTPNTGIYANQPAYSASLMYGAYFKCDINKHFQFEGGIGALEYGAKYLRLGAAQLTQNDTSPYNDQLIQKAFYVTVPLMIKYKISPTSSVIGGFRNSWKLKNEVVEITGTKIGNTYHDETFTVRKDIPDQSNTYDFGWVLGYEYNFSEKFSASLLINIGTLPLHSKEYIEGWKNYGDWENFYVVNMAGNYNNSISLRVCYNLMGNN